MRTVIAEVEPNDTFDAGSGPLVGGDQGTGGISASTDVDFWVLNVNVLGSVDHHHRRRRGARPRRLLACTCTAPTAPRSSAYDDDSGPGLYSLITYNFTATGTYYVKVRGYSATYTGNYVLNVGSPVPPPANDTCAGAIAIPFVEGFSVATTTMGAANDYNAARHGLHGLRGGRPRHRLHRDHGGRAGDHAVLVPSPSTPRSTS